MCNVSVCVVVGDAQGIHCWKTFLFTAAEFHGTNSCRLESLMLA